MVGVGYLAICGIAVMCVNYSKEENKWERRINSSQPYTYDDAITELDGPQGEFVDGNGHTIATWEDEYSDDQGFSHAMYITLTFDTNKVLIKHKVTRE